jgi:hypothetical protein
VGILIPGVDDRELTSDVIAVEVRGFQKTQVELILLELLSRRTATTGGQTHGSDATGEQGANDKSDCGGEA